MRTVYLDMGRLQSLRRAAQSGEISNKLLKRAAEVVVGYVNSSWSETSPSAPGQPPAVVTGKLKKSVRIYELNKGHVQILWLEEYSKFLEFGTTNMAPRPFVTPATEYARKILAELGKEVVLQVIDNA